MLNFEAKSKPIFFSEITFSNMFGEEVSLAATVLSQILVEELHVDKSGAFRLRNFIRDKVVDHLERSLISKCIITDPPSEDGGQGDESFRVILCDYNGVRVLVGGNYIKVGEGSGFDLSESDWCISMAVASNYLLALWDEYVKYRKRS